MSVTDGAVQLIRLHIADPGLTFHAGQYLEIVHPQGAGIPLSIASSPLRLPALEFHYSSQPGSTDAALVDDLLQRREPLLLEGPAGDVFVTADAGDPLLLVAGGTGASQALAIIDDLLLRQKRLPVTFLCCADTPEDFYFAAALAERAPEWLRIEYVADPRRDPENRGMQWLSTHATDHLDGRVLLCGGPPFVYAALDALTSGGMPAELPESDVFSYAPRA